MTTEEERREWLERNYERAVNSPVYEPVDPAAYHAEMDAREDELLDDEYCRDCDRTPSGCPDHGGPAGPKGAPRTLRVEAWRAWMEAHNPTEFTGALAQVDADGQPLPS